MKTLASILAILFTLQSTAFADNWAWWSRFQGSRPSGDDISLDTSEFDNNLSSADDTVQKAFNTLDELVAGGSSVSVDGVEVTDPDFVSTGDIDFVATGSSITGDVNANSVALATDTTGNYVATIADAGNSTITVVNSGSENAAITLDVIDVNCTNCLGQTEIIDSYMLNTGDTSTGAITINDNNASGSTLLTVGDVTDADSVQIFGDLTITGGDLTFGTSLILSGGDTTSLNLIDAIDATTEATLESAIDSLTNVTINGDITLTENNSITLVTNLTADGKFSGVTEAGTAGAALAFGDVIYLAAADSRWELTDASAIATSGDVKVGICVLAAAGDGSATEILLYGTIRADANFPALTISAPVHISETAGDVVVAAPTTTDSVTRRLGFAITADSMLFNPSNDYYTHI